MTIGLIDLMKRTAPFLLIALPLSHVLQACGPKEMNAAFDRVEAAVTGKPDPTATATALYLTTAAVSSSSSSSSVQPVESVSVAVVETASSSEAYVPPPIECVQTPWHGMNFSCDGKTSWPVE